MKTNFELTVEKLASAPSGTRAGMSAILDNVFGPGKDMRGVHKIMQTAGGAILGGTILGAGSLLFAKAKDLALGNQDAEKARDIESGKLEAQSLFKAHSLASLAAAHDAVLKKIMKDEIISKADKETMHSAYGTMKRFAPNLAADENAAKSFLREHAIYGTGPSYAALKNLADAEQAVARAGGVT